MARRSSAGSFMTRSLRTTRAVSSISLQVALAHLYDDDWVTDVRNGLSKKDNKILDSPGFVSETLSKLPPVRTWSDELTKSILYKWNTWQQGSFIRIIDGNPMNVSCTNLMYVSHQAAMEHIDDWKVDWDMNLTDEEIALVRTSEWRDGLTFKKKT